MFFRSRLSHRMNVFVSLHSCHRVLLLLWQLFLLTKPAWNKFCICESICDILICPTFSCNRFNYFLTLPNCANTVVTINKLTKKKKKETMMPKQRRVSVFSWPQTHLDALFFFFYIKSQQCFVQIQKQNYISI